MMDADELPTNLDGWKRRFRDQIEEARLAQLTDAEREVLVAFYPERGRPDLPWSGSQPMGRHRLPGARVT
jgi:hypothetical protein